MSVGLDNNNPGNLKAVPSHMFIGEKISTCPPWRQFYSIGYGYRALMKQILIFSQNGVSNINQLINKWCNDKPEIKENYLKLIMKYTGYTLIQSLNFNDEKVLKQLAYCISEFENDVEPITKDINEGYDLLTNSKYI